MPLKSLNPARAVSLVMLAVAACAGDEPPPPPTDAGLADAATRDGETCLEADCDGAMSSHANDAAPPTQSSVGSCCETQASPGCEEPTIEECVCAVDRLCCAGAWDERCVELVETEGCGQCGAPPSTACEAREESDTVPSMLRGTLGEIDGVATHALELSCGSIAVPDLLFEFTAPEQGNYEFATASDDVVDTVLAVFDGACDGEELACNDDDGGELSSRLSLDLASGQQVLIAVESWTEESGEVEVAITVGTGSSPVDAESCLPAELSAPLPAIVTGDANDDTDLLTPSCALFGSAGEALYLFTAEQAGMYRFDTRGSDADTLVQVLEGDCAGEELACNDDSELGGLAAIADLDLSAGQTVLVNVDSLDGSGSYALSVDRFDPTAEPTPSSDDGSCCSPQVSGGCADETISACVCATNDYCCADIWDAQCVDDVTFLGCGVCASE